MKIINKKLRLNTGIVLYEVKIFSKVFYIENPQTWDDDVFFELLKKYINENTI